MTVKKAYNEYDGVLDRVFKDVKSPTNVFDTVTHKTSITHIIEVNVDAMSDLNNNDEVVVLINGRIVRRYSVWQAERAGLVIPTK